MVSAEEAAERLAWIVAAAAGGVAVTQALGRTDAPAVAIAQALTPLIAAAAVPASAIGVWRRRSSLVVMAAASAVALGRVVAPAIRRGHLSASTDASPLTVAHANMLYTNHRHAREAAAALVACDADVLALSELTFVHERALKASDVAGRYAHRFSRPARDSHGLAIWSKLPLVDCTVEPMIRRPGMVARIETVDGPVRLILAHPDPPMKWQWLTFWEPSLQHLDRLGHSAGPPTIIVADLNAARWHPPLRRLLNGGWRDAHEDAGHGLRASWPERGLVPPFVRLDHALVDEHLDVIDVKELNIPGSDHRGFVVTVALRDGNGQVGAPASLSISRKIEGATPS